MDQIFDRLERLFKSWVTPEEEAPLRGHRPSGDSDLDEAMSELDDFLDRDRTATEARERERLAKEARAQAASGGAQRPAGPPQIIVEAYKTLGLPYGAAFAQVKAAYKKLLMLHHPDRNNENAESSKKATEISARINMAYQRLETWTMTGKLPE